MFQKFPSIGCHEREMKNLQFVMRKTTVVEIGRDSFEKIGSIFHGFRDENNKVRCQVYDFVIKIE